jgi:hypothetical protein
VHCPWVLQTEHWDYYLQRFSSFFFLYSDPVTFLPEEVLGRHILRGPSSVGYFLFLKQTHGVKRPPVNLNDFELVSLIYIGNIAAIDFTL